MSTPGQRKAGIASNTGGDLYDTPQEISLALIARENFSGPIWEPAAGAGMLATAFRDWGYVVIEGDITERPGRTKPLHLVEDFLAVRAEAASARGRSLITNPPFSLLTQFMAHAARFDLDKWALLIPLTALAGKARASTIYKRHPPTRVWVLADRIKFRRVGYEGKLSPLGTHAWAVWHRDVPKFTTMEWIT